MASAEATICNKALARVGHKVFIEDLDNDKSEEADIARLFYADERDSLLMQAPWPFATRRATLAEVDYNVEPQRAGWQKVYRLPNDLLEPLYIWPGGLSIPQISTGSGVGGLEVPLALQGVWQNPRAPRIDQRIPFAIEASSVDDDDVLLCDYAGVGLIYTARITDVGRFSALFSDALAWHLASVFAMPLAVKPEIQSLCEKRAQDATQLAIARHFQGQQEDMSPESEMIVGRL
jgi:hypothetical protein